VLWKGTRKVNNQAGHLFRLAASGLHGNRTPLGNYLCRTKAKLGLAAATTAAAHKIRGYLPYHRKNQLEYDEAIWATRDAKRKEIPGQA